MAFASASACSDDNNGTTGAGGTTVQFTGAAGTTAAAGTTGTAGTTAMAFESFEPCPSQADYVTGTAITVSPSVIGYTPKCLMVPAGSTVTIGASAFHPLSGTADGSADNPIPGHQTATTTVTFPTAGFYTFQCDNHFSVGMKGVVWVTP